MLQNLMIIVLITNTLVLVYLYYISLQSFKNQVSINQCHSDWIGKLKARIEALENHPKAYGHGSEYVYKPGDVVLVNTGTGTKDQALAAGTVRESTIATVDVFEGIPDTIVVYTDTQGKKYDSSKVVMLVADAKEVTT